MSLALDTILHTYPGDADYYFNAAQFEELVLPALLAIGTGVGVNPRGGPQLIAQMAVVRPPSLLSSSLLSSFLLSSPVPSWPP